MKFCTMDPEDALRAIEGHRNVLDTTLQEENKIVQALSCPSCGGGPVCKVVDADRPFSSDKYLANFNCRCQECKCLFSPHTSIIIERADPTVQDEADLLPSLQK